MNLKSTIALAVNSYIRARPREWQASISKHFIPVYKKNYQAYSWLITLYLILKKGRKKIHIIVCISNSADVLLIRAQESDFYASTILCARRGFSSRKIEIEGAKSWIMSKFLLIWVIPSAFDFSVPIVQTILVDGWVKDVGLLFFKRWTKKETYFCKAEVDRLALFLFLYNLSRICSQYSSSHFLPKLDYIPSILV